MSRCNFCQLKKLKEEAKKTGFKITKKPGTFGLRGYEYYLHPKDIKIDPEKHREKYFRLWVMDIGNHCEC